MLQKNVTYNSSVFNLMFLQKLFSKNINEWATQDKSVARLNKEKTTHTPEVRPQLQCLPNFLKFQLTLQTTIPFRLAHSLSF